MARAISTCSRHPFRAANDVATAVCDRALLFASIWLSAGQSQEHNGTVAATEEMSAPIRYHGCTSIQVEAVSPVVLSRAMISCRPSRSMTVTLSPSTRQSSEADFHSSDPLDSALK